MEFHLFADWQIHAITTITEGLISLSLTFVSQFECIHLYSQKHGCGCIKKSMKRSKLNLGLAYSPTLNLELPNLDKSLERLVDLNLGMQIITEA